MGKNMVSSEQQTRMRIKGKYWHDENNTHLVWGTLYYTEHLRPVPLVLGKFYLN